MRGGLLGQLEIMVSDDCPVLLYWERLPPYEIVAAASLAKVTIEPRPDPKANKDYVVNLKVADGYVLASISCKLRWACSPAKGSTALNMEMWLAAQQQCTTSRSS